MVSSAVFFGMSTLADVSCCQCIEGRGDTSRYLGTHQLHPLLLDSGKSTHIQPTGNEEYDAVYSKRDFFRQRAKKIKWIAVIVVNGNNCFHLIKSELGSV
jgi:hypothetical protein